MIRYSTRVPGMIAAADHKANAVIHKGAFDILAMARQRVPVRTGNLKNNSQTELGDLEAAVVFSAEYAYFVEGGTRKMSARPFLRPAFDVVAPQIVAGLERVMRP